MGQMDTVAETAIIGPQVSNPPTELTSYCCRKLCRFDHKLYETTRFKRHYEVKIG